MIKKIVFIHLLLASVILASTYNFVEHRYSDALDRTMSLEGEISFFPQKLHINYKNSDTQIIYEDLFVKLKKSGAKAELADGELQRMSEYFKIILMLYRDDIKELENRFEITKGDQEILLYPKDYIKEFLKKIRLKKNDNKLKEIKLFFNNNDKITIIINDEIR